MKISMDKKWSTCFIIVCSYLFVFQNPLENNIAEIFSYWDELFPLLLLAINIFFLDRGKIIIRKNINKKWIPFYVFFLTALLGTVIYNYQPLRAAAIDLYTNIKFFLVLILSARLFETKGDIIDYNRVIKHIRIIVLLLAGLSLVDEIIGIFPADQIRYGLKTIRLFYSHPTYLAGALVFLIAILTLLNDNKNGIYILFALINLFLTLRSKSIGGALVYIVLFLYIRKGKQKLKLWQIAFIGVAVCFVAWNQISFYFIELGGQSARSVLTLTSIKVMKDFFPIGTGFGTFGSHVAGEIYSPVYYKYGLHLFGELSPSNPRAFFDDTYWPIVIAQSGFIGTIAYCFYLLVIFMEISKVKCIDINAYLAGLFSFIYILISSTSEPAFNNAVGIPIAFCIGVVISKVRTEK